MKNINKVKNTIKIISPIIAVFVLILVFIFDEGKLMWLKSSLSPILYAFIFAYIMDSLVRVIMRRLKARRPQAILLSFILLIGLVSILFSILIPRLMDNTNAVISFITSDNMNWDLEDIVIKIENIFNDKYIDSILEQVIQFGDQIKDKINDIILFISNSVISTVTNIGSSLLSVLTTIILAIYMLIEKNDLIARSKRLLYAFLTDNNAERVLDSAKLANKIFKSFLVGKIVDCSIVAVILIIAFSIAGVPYATLMGTIIGIFNIIPMFGPILGSIPVVIVSLFINPIKALVALIIILVVGQIDANFIDPKIVGNNIGVSPFWVISAVTVGGTAFGFAGLLFGVPTLVFIKTLIEGAVSYKLKEKGMEDYQVDNLRLR